MEIHYYSEDGDHLFTLRQEILPKKGDVVWIKTSLMAPKAKTTFKDQAKLLGRYEVIDSYFSIDLIDHQMGDNIDLANEIVDSGMCLKIDTNTKQLLYSKIRAEVVLTRKL